MNRRQFLLSSSMAALAATHAKFVVADPAIRSIGIQLFSVPKLLEKDFRQGIAMLAGMGYKETEFYGPYPFSAPSEIAKWNSLTPQLGFSGSGFFGLSTSQARSVLDENRLTAPSMHTDLVTLQTKMSGRATVAG
jgi:hypothetical protein